MASFIKNATEEERNETLKVATEDIRFRIYMGIKTTKKELKEILEESLIVVRRCDKYGTIN